MSIIFSVLIVFAVFIFLIGGVIAWLLEDGYEDPTDYD